MYGWLANLTVARKLMLGFGLLCLMSVLIFVAGWRAIDSLSYRMERMSAVNRLMADFADLRLQQAALLKGGSDQAAVAVLTERIAGVGEGLERLRGIFASDLNRQKVDEMARHLVAYKSAVGDLEASYQQINDARTERRISGDKALQRLDALDALLADDSKAVEGAQALYREVKGIQMQFLYARFETRAYTYSGNDKQFDASTAAVDKTLASLIPLREVLNGADTSISGELEAHLRTYRATLDRNQAALLRIDDTLRNVQAQGDALIRVSKALYENQMQLRLDDTREAFWTLASCLVLALILGLAGATVITRQIVPPLRVALQSVQRIAGGDLSSPTDVQRKDEIGQLQHGLQDMAGSLRQLIGHIGDGAVQIASATEELSAITQQTSAGASEQKLETEQVATAMHEMATSVQDVARNAVETAQAVDQVAAGASSGAGIVRNAIERIESLSVEVELTGTAVSKLVEESSRIGGMLDVIKAVAEQTNLLALNAAIEAARAGEAGRGFAVVADEVRGLAQRTQRSTEDIEVLVAALRQGTLNAVQRMDASRNLTSDSVRLARDAGQALGGITASIGAVQGMTQQIAAAAEQQGAVAEEINRSVLNVRAITGQAHTASEQTRLASLELARLGSALRGEVQRFRL